MKVPPDERHFVRRIAFLLLSHGGLEGFASLRLEVLPAVHQADHLCFPLYSHVLAHVLLQRQLRLFGGRHADGGVLLRGHRLGPEERDGAAREHEGLHLRGVLHDGQLRDAFSLHIVGGMSPLVCPSAVEPRAHPPAVLPRYQLVFQLRRLHLALRCGHLAQNAQ